MKKLLLGIICGTGMLLMLGGCGSLNNGQENAQTSATDTGFVMTYQGVELALDNDYAAVKEQLGGETKPSNDIPPCDGEGGIMTEHYYEGMILGTDENNSISYLHMDSDSKDHTDIGTKQGLHVGDPIDRAKELYGTPEFESEYVVSFVKDEQTLTCGIDDNGSTISYLYLTRQ